MSLFSKIKNVFNSSSIDIPDAQTIYFKNGEMYKVYPTDKESWYDARYLVSDGVKYDLENLDDLRCIPIPAFTNIDIMHGYGITGSLEYVLRMKAGNLRRKGLLKESNSILERIHLFMGAADNGYQEKDFLIYSHLLLKEGHFEESEKYKAIVQSYLKTLRVCHNSFSFYNSAKRFYVLFQTSQLPANYHTQLHHSLNKQVHSSARLSLAISKNTILFHQFINFSPVPRLFEQIYRC